MKPPRFKASTFPLEHETSEVLKQQLDKESELEDIILLTIRLSKTLTVPISIDSLSPANDIIEILSKIILFQNKPTLLFKGKLIEPYLSLKSQGIKTGDEITVYDRLISTLINLNSGTKNDPIKKTNELITDIKKWKASKSISEYDLFEKTYSSIINELKRLADQWFTNLENLLPDSVLYANLVEETDSNEQTVEVTTDEIEEDDSPCSVASLLNRPNDYCMKKSQNKLHKMNQATVLKPTPKEISDDPLPRLSNPIYDSRIKHFDDQLFPNSSTGWKW